MLINRHGDATSCAFSTSGQDGQGSHISAAALPADTEKLALIAALSQHPEDADDASLVNSRSDCVETA